MGMVNAALFRPGKPGEVSKQKGWGWIGVLAYIASVWFGTQWMHDPIVDKILMTLTALGVQGINIGHRDAK